MDFLKKNWTYVVCFILGIMIGGIIAKTTILIVKLALPIGAIALIIVIARYVQKRKEKKNEEEDKRIGEYNDYGIGD